MNLKIFLYGFILSVIVSCSDDEPEIVSADDQAPLIELEFSHPPIALPGTQALFAADIPYDAYAETTFDIFLPVSAAPTGLVIFIHGGGFTGGDKAFIYTDNHENEVFELLNNGIAVATINYRLLSPGDRDGVLKSLNDSKRALQYIRYIHNELNIDQDNIVLFGSSAGASTALWLATNDDLSVPNSLDPVQRESTRVKGVALHATQSSLDIEKRWLGEVFAEFDSSLEDLIQVYGADSFYSFYGVSSREAYESPEIEAYRRQVDMLTLLSSDDPEIWVTNTGGHNEAPMTSSSFNHHPFHAREIKAFADAAGVANVTTYGNPILYADTDDEDYVAFLRRKISE